MRHAVVTAAVTVSGVLLLLSLKPHSTATTAGPPISTGAGPGGTTSSATPGASPTSDTTPDPAPSSSGDSSAVTRSVVGSTAQTRYGPVQVAIAVRNGRIVDISVPEYPSGTRRDQEINTYALPLLDQEAISAQSARIDAVSGATFTSDGYVNSLQSAIDKAGL